MEPCILALDQGTTSSRALLFDTRPGPSAWPRNPSGRCYPNPGWVEHDPMEIWSTQLAAAREAIAEARIDPVGSPRSGSPTRERRPCSGIGHTG